MPCLNKIAAGQIFTSALTWEDLKSPLKLKIGDFSLTVHGFTEADP